MLRGRQPGIASRAVFRNIVEPKAVSTIGLFPADRLSQELVVSRVAKLSYSYISNLIMPCELFFAGKLLRVLCSPLSQCTA